MSPNEHIWNVQQGAQRPQRCTKLQQIGLLLQYVRRYPFRWIFCSLTILNLNVHFVHFVRLSPVGVPRIMMNQTPTIYDV